MGKPTFDSGTPRPRSRIRGRNVPHRGRRGFGFPLSKEGMKLPNKIGGFKLTRGTETSQYPEERTSTETPLVVASESGPGQCLLSSNWNRLESRATAGDSPVQVLKVE